MSAAAEPSPPRAIRRVLVVDDEENIRHLLLVILKRAGYEAEAVPDGEVALRRLEDGDFGVVLSDIRMPRMDGLSFLKEVRRRGLGAYVVMMSAYGSTDVAIEAMKCGAYDYFGKPFKADEVVLTLRKVEERERLCRENERLRDELRRERGDDEIVGRSEGMRRILDTVRKVAPYKTTVLVTGESGTGKELIARALHRHSDRAGGPLIPINCGAIPENLLESELFGHSRGAFTGAVRAHKGLFEEADRGTLFLDEVAELPLNLQVKLLRVIEDEQVRKVGDTRLVGVDVRLVAATSRDLQEMVDAGRFREDLFYRLNVLHLRVPPLRDRREDIPLLAEHFLAHYAARTGRGVRRIGADAMRLLARYDWPGNVRELENTVERAVILCEGEEFRAEHVPARIAEATSRRAAHSPDDLSVKRGVRALEVDLISRALRATGGNRTRAALLLELSHRALLYKIKEYGLEGIERTPPPGRRAGGGD
ncbi:sigma-54 dependent transcriptional regulator [Myxococcota bacterium]|nr:sigma-54 dependent transcriptional regulator [Myxococcota bacterium]